MAQKFRKKPVVIEAVQWRGLEEPIIDFLQGGEGIFHFNQTQGKLYISTLEGVMEASVGDWIIKGVNGEFYPCKPDIFEKTYEAVREDK